MKNKHRTHKSAAKRYKITAGGKLLHRTATIRHRRASKSDGQIRRIKTMKELTGVFGKKMRQLLGTA